jgi:hypothetical protein
MEERFGIPASEFGDTLLFRHRQSWWLLKKGPSVPIPGTLKVSMAGLKAFQKVGSFIKPTTRLIQLLGPRATRSILNLSRSELRTLLNEGAMDSPDCGVEDGYVILCFEEYVLGLGLQIRRKVLSQIPRKDLPFYKSD